MELPVSQTEQLTDATPQRGGKPWPPDPSADHVNAEPGRNELYDGQKGHFFFFYFWQTHRSGWYFAVQRLGEPAEDGTTADGGRLVRSDRIKRQHALRSISRIHPLTSSASSTDLYRACAALRGGNYGG